MKLALNNKITFYLSLLISLVYYVAFLANMVQWQFTMLICLYVVVLLYSIRNKHKTIVLLFFLIAFFVFLLGKDFFLICCASFLPDDIKQVESLNEYAQEIKFGALYNSLLFLYLGSLFSLKLFKSCNTEKEVVYKADIAYIKRVSLLLFYLTAFFSIWQIVVGANFVFTYSYANLDATVNLPHSVVLLSFLNTLSFVYYLNTYPSKKELVKPLFIFVLLTVSSVLMGSRGTVIVTLMFLLIYFMSRDYGKMEQERFLKKRFWYILFSITPFVLIGLNLFAFVRSSEEVVSKGFLMDIAGFFIQQGGSSNLICLVEYYRSSLPETNISYTFGPIINHFKDLVGITSNAGFDALTYEALYRNNLGATLTYLDKPSYYYSGGGLGTQYIAELIADFGYLGVILFNFFFGILLRYLSFDISKSIMMRVFSSFIIMGILFLPRDFCFSWFVKFLMPAYLLPIFLIYGISIIYYKRYPGLRIYIHK